MQEALLLEGGEEEGDLFDFERELTDVAGIPEELLNAVAELTGEDTSTLRYVAHLDMAGTEGNFEVLLWPSPAAASDIAQV